MAKSNDKDDPLRQAQRLRTRLGQIEAMRAGANARYDELRRRAIQGVPELIVQIAQLGLEAERRDLGEVIDAEFPEVSEGADDLPRPSEAPGPIPDIDDDGPPGTDALGGTAARRMTGRARA